MRPDTKLIFALTTFLFLSLNIYASDWQSSFFTDDSSYYLKLHKDGFSQRFRVKSEHCGEITSAQIVMKDGRTIPFAKKNKSTWKDLYGINESEQCWFEARVSGIDLSSPRNNYYVIKINSSHYFSNYSSSILPSKKITNSRGKVRWISLGQPGATVVDDGGVFFKIWEPVASDVHLIVNGKTIDMSSNGDGSRRCFSKYLPSATAGTKYQFKFLKGGSYEKLEVGNGKRLSAIKVDPMARKIVYDRKGGSENGYVNPKAVVVGRVPYSWRYDRRVLDTRSSKKNNWLIYQVWPLTFNPKKSDGKYISGTFDSITDKINYIHGLGVTAVELLPVNETRFYASWGYALDSLLLIEKGYGSMYSLMRLSDKLHRKKLKVIFDVVLNHINNSLIRDPLSKNVSKSKYYDGGTDWGPRPDFKSPMVKKWIADSLVILARDFHLDGFRFDMTKFVYKGNPAGYKFLQELTTLLKLVYPDFYSSAEELEDNVWATYPVSSGGMGFSSQWNDNYKNFFEHKFNNYRSNSRSVNMYSLRKLLQGYSNHEGKNFGSPKRTVNYIGSHDFIGNKDPFIRIVSEYKAYEWCGNNNFYRVRPLEDPQDKEYKFRKIHNYFTHDATRMAYGTLFTKPGGVLFFQGEELANDINIQNEWDYVAALKNNSFPSKNVDLDRYIRSHRMPWEYLDPASSSELRFLSRPERKLFTGHYKFFKDLLHFRKEYRYINYSNAKNVKVDSGRIMYQVSSGNSDFFIVANYGSDRSAKWISFPEASKKWWQEIYNSSDKKYGSSTNKFLNIISNLKARSNQVRLKGSSISIFKNVNIAKINKDLYLRGTINNWETRSNFLLKDKADRGQMYGTDFVVSSAGMYEFKLGTDNWEIEVGASNSKTMRSGSLSYHPGMGNIRVFLNTGNYRFIFDLESFNYKFISLN